MIMDEKSWRYVCGIMSGTSLDGLDIALCAIRRQDNHWGFRIISATTIEYPDTWKQRLPRLIGVSGEELAQLHTEFGTFIGEACANFLEKEGLPCEFISSHGHTVHHRPDTGFTFQLGDGAAIAAASGFPVVCDFRSGDVALGGQGAPLVPVGDELLFPKYSACLNLGGFANISFRESGRRVAFDICPLNKALNHYSKILGHEYDDGGRIAASGKLIPELLQKLDALPFYQISGPRSLGEEWLNECFYPVLSGFEDRIPDLLRTLSEHMANQLKRPLDHISPGMVLVSGGGAYNSFLLSLLREKTAASLHIPDNNLVDFKEALVFAFLGLLRMEEKVNVLSSVTGASRDHSSGAVYLP